MLKERAAAQILRAARGLASRTCASSDSHSPFTLLPPELLLEILGFVVPQGALEKTETSVIASIGLERPDRMERDKFLESVLV